MQLDNETVEGFSECADVNTAGVIRVSFGIYNTEAEVDEFLEFLLKAIGMAREDVNHYTLAVPEY